MEPHHQIRINIKLDRIGRTYTAIMEGLIGFLLAVAIGGFLEKIDGITLGVAFVGTFVFISFVVFQYKVMCDEFARKHTRQRAVVRRPPVN